MRKGGNMFKYGLTNNKEWSIKMLVSAQKEATLTERFPGSSSLEGRHFVFNEPLSNDLVDAIADSRK